jgi:hypothetical protein
MSGLHAADGSINVTVVDGTSITGLYAADGSWNVVNVTGSTDWEGVYHACGALNVTLVSSGLGQFYAANGSINVSEDPYILGTMRVTAVSGSLSGGGLVGQPIGLLLALTYAA